MGVSERIWFLRFGLIFRFFHIFWFWNQLFLQNCYDELTHVIAPHQSEFGKFCVHESEIKLFLSSWIDVNIFKIFLLYHTNYALLRLKNAIPCNATDCLNGLVLLKLCWRFLSLYSWCKSFDQYLLFKIVKCKKLLTEILLVFTSCYSCDVSYINHNDFIVRACL